MQIFATNFPLIAIIAIRILKNRALCLSHFYTIFNQHISIIYYVYNTNQNFSARLVRDKYEVSGWLVRDKHVIFGPTSGHLASVVTP